jgi:hypothetical protein
MRLIRLSEYFDANRTGYSVPRSLLGVRRPRGLPARVFPAKISQSGSSSHRLNLLFRDPGRCRRVVLVLARQPYRATPMRFCAPPAFQTRRVGVLHRFHPMRHPPSAFLRPLRVSSSTRPVTLFHATDAHGVFRSPEPFPPCQLYLARRLAIPSRRFSSESEDPKPRPQGFLSAGSPFPVAEYFIRRPGRCSPELSSASAAFCEPVWLRHSTELPLLTFFTGAVRARSGVGLQRLPTGSPASLPLESAGRSSVSGLLRGRHPKIPSRRSVGLGPRYLSAALFAALPRCSARSVFPFGVSGPLDRWTRRPKAPRPASREVGHPLRVSRLVA